ncbi:MAG: xanthine dehydrogenase family protein subunit M [Hyphomicrobiaceae bacterium]
MYDFTYVRPASIDDAAKALTGEAKLLAGGQTLLPTLKQRLASPGKLVDLGGLAELRGIHRDPKAIGIGACTTHVDVATSADVKATIPALAKLAAGIGDPQVRNRGTIGGSLANNDPNADYPAAILALGGIVHTNKRQITADDYFTGLFTTALGPDEIIVAIGLPIPKRAGYAKMEQRASRYALVGVFVAETEKGVRVAVTGAGAGGVFRSRELEAALSGGLNAAAAGATKVPSTGLMSDLHASADYRAALISALAERAVASAA